MKKLLLKTGFYLPLGVTLDVSVLKNNWQMKVIIYLCNVTLVKKN